MAVTSMGRVFGGSDILRNLKKEIRSIDGDITTGLRLGLADIEGDSNQNAPIEFGVLRGSSFTDVQKTSKGSQGRVGYVAKYAAWVHEMPGKLKGQPRPKRKGQAHSSGVYWQGGMPKFLEIALKEGASRLLSTIRRFAKR